VGRITVALRLENSNGHQGLDFKIITGTKDYVLKISDTKD
jgi:hypothetical protein